MILDLLDENVARQVDSAVRTWHRKAAGPRVDVVRVGEPPDLPTGSSDPDILRWAGRAGRAVVTDDVNTMPRHLADHLAAGGGYRGCSASGRGHGRRSLSPSWR